MKFIISVINLLGILIFTEIIYLFILDFVVFNETFQKSYYSIPLFYLSPIIVAFLLMFLLALDKRRMSFFKSIFLTLSFVYCFLSIFMITGTYCQDFKNLTFLYKCILLTILSFNLILYFKYIHPSLNLTYKIIIMLSTIIITIDLIFFSSLYFVHIFFDQYIFDIH